MPGVQGALWALDCALAFAQGLAEREVLGLAVGGEARRVGGQERERRRVVLAVLGEVEVDAAKSIRSGGALKVP